MNDRRVECRFLWIIEDYLYCWPKKGECLTSPDFTADDLESTSWCLVLYPRGKRDINYISLYLLRKPLDGGPEEISLNYELSLFVQLESTCRLEVDNYTFKKGDTCGWPQFLKREDIFPHHKTEDVLTLECRVWKGEGKVDAVTTIRARTCIAVEKFFFLHVVENFSSLEPNQKNTVEIQYESKEGVVISSSLYFTDDPCCEGEMIVEIASSDNNHVLWRRSVSILSNAPSNLIDDQFVDEINDIKKRPLSLTRQDILNKKSEYLPDDKLSLFCDCIFYKGLEFKEIGEIDHVIPGTGVNKTASAWIPIDFLPMGKKLKIDFTDEIRKDRGVGNITLEVRVENFSTNTEVASVFHGERCEPLSPCLFHVRVFAGGSDGWLAVFPEVKISDDEKRDVYLTLKNLWWTVSIIDKQGHSRFPQYFENYPNERDELTEAKYLEKSFIIDRADDLLSEDVLRLRCDIHFDLDLLEEIVIKSVGDYEDFEYAFFVKKIPQDVDLDASNIFLVLDLTSQNLALSRFHKSSVHNMPPVSPSINSESKKDGANISEDVWIFDTDPDRFLLSFARRPGNLGRFLIASSPVIRRCINAPMRERGEKRVDLSNVGSETFKMVMYFLESGRVPKCKFQELVKVYEFSHLYLMENLQQRSAKCMVERCDSLKQLIDVERIADQYSDEYLLKMFITRRLEFEHFSGGFETKELGNPDAIADRPDSDCFT